MSDGFDYGKFPQSLVTDDAVQQRYKEGWFFAGNGNIIAVPQGAVFVEALTPKFYFHTDEQAVEFVKKRAAEGSPYHIECLNFWAMLKLTT